MTRGEKVDAYMPLWIGDYLADTMGFNALQHGAYLLLLMAYWRQRAPLPDDDDDLAGIARCSRAEWKAIRPKLARKFQVGDGVWRHGRADEELASAIERKQAAVRKAKAGAEAKWKKVLVGSPTDAPSNATSNAPSIGQALLGQCPSTSTTPSPSESSEPIGSAGAGAPAPVDNPEDEARRLIAETRAWLERNGLSAGDAKAFRNKVAKDYPAVARQAFEEAMKTSATVGEPQALVMGIAKRLAGERKDPVTVADSPMREQAQAQLAEQAAKQVEPPAPEVRARLEAARQAAASAASAPPHEGRSMSNTLDVDTRVTCTGCACFVNGWCHNALKAGLSLVRSRQEVGSQLAALRQHCPGFKPRPVVQPKTR